MRTIAIIAILALSGCGPSTPRELEIQRKKEREALLFGSEIDAIARAQDAVRERLRQSDDVLFSLKQQASLSDGIGGQIPAWTVSGTVYTKDKFGKVTKQYRVTLTCSQGTWTTLSVEFDGKNVYVNPESIHGPSLPTASESVPQASPSPSSPAPAATADASTKAPLMTASPTTSGSKPVEPIAKPADDRKPLDDRPAAVAPSNSPKPFSSALAELSKPTRPWQVARAWTINGKVVRGRLKSWSGSQAVLILDDRKEIKTTIDSFSEADRIWVGNALR